jgi:glycine/D-amino acid oxidase-like deaminating enzyme
MYNSKKGNETAASSFGYWTASSVFAAYDVVIVGGGFTGLCAGITLLKNAPKLRVAILESELLGTRASSRNAGFVCFGSASEIQRDVEIHGTEQVQTLLRLKLKGVKVLIEYLKTRKTSYHRAPAYELLMSDFPEAREKALDSLEPLNKVFHTAIGVSDYFKQNPALSKQYGLPGLGEVISMKYEAQVNPANVVAALTLLFKNLGGIFINGCTALQYHRNHDKIVVQTTFGELKANHLVIASNAFAPILQPKLNIQPNRAQVLVTSPLAKMPFKGNYHINFGYLYFRNVEGNRLLLGGARNVDLLTEQTAELGLNSEIQAWLVDFLQSKLLQGVPHTIEAQWSGIMGFGSELFPTHEEVEEDVFMAAGMNGMGTALGPALGYETAMKILKKRNTQFKKTQPKAKIPF